MRERIRARLINLVYVLGYGWGSTTMSRLAQVVGHRSAPARDDHLRRASVSRTALLAAHAEGGTFVAKRFTDFRRDFP